MKWLTSLCLALIVLAGCSKDNSETASGPKPSHFEDQKATVTATVKALDQNTRLITLRGEEGNEWTFKASNEIHNLHKVKVGDRVTIDYYESVAVNVQPPGEAINEIRTAIDRAEPGQPPAGIAAQHTTITSTVESIDKKKSAVTLRGPGTSVRTVKVRDPKKLENVRKGDRVVVTYTESMAVAVTPAPAAAPAPAAP